MLYKTSDILRDVRVSIDENKTNEQLITEGDVDTLMLDDIIRSKIEEGVRLVVGAAPLYMLDGGSTFGDAVYWRKDYSGWVLLPEDFFRLVVFKMSDWERPVYKAITPDSPQYNVQHSRYKGLRGTPQKPVVAICVRQEGRVLELYSCNDNTATVEQALYMPLPKEDDGYINIPERCYRSAVYEIAALTEASVGQQDFYTLLTQLSKGLLI